MDARILQHCFFLLFCILYVSGSSFAEIPPFDAIDKLLDDQENQITFTSPESAAELDAAYGNVPIVEPTTPALGPPTATPTMNPPTNQMPPMTTGPNVNPTTPIPPTNNQPVTNPSPTTTTPPSSGRSWCIAKPSASQPALQVALDYACGYGGDCSAIQQDGSCYEPNTVKDHASYAFNSYYQKNQMPASCDFGGTAQLINTDPSNENCSYPSSSTSPTIPPPATPINFPTPPSTMTPVNPYPPGGQVGYGSEPTDYGLGPTGNPNAATSISYYLSLLSTTIWFMLSLVSCSYL